MTTTCSFLPPFNKTFFLDNPEIFLSSSISNSFLSLSLSLSLSLALSLFPRRRKERQGSHFKLWNAPTENSDTLKCYFHELLKHTIYLFNHIVYFDFKGYLFTSFCHCYTCMLFTSPNLQGQFVLENWLRKKRSSVLQFT